MTKTKNIILGIAVFGVISSLTILLALYSNGYSNKTSADFPNYSTLADINNNSSCVIVGAVKEKEKDIRKIDVGLYEPQSYIVFNIIVDEVVKGNVNVGDEIAVKMLSEEIATETAGYLEIDKKYILFLELYDNDIPASLINPIQGQLKIKEDNTLDVKKGNNIFTNQKNGINTSSNSKSEFTKESVLNELKSINN